MRQRTIVCPLIQNDGHYLLCKMAADRGVTINEEFDDYAWVKGEDLQHYDLNAATRLTLSQKGLL
ncbi:hypothetical protein RPN21_17125 [Klebsiella aerogenes]|uniref:hypothetical protein n=1 Tax=Klebsiella aerogenes TaxID=548 RepID=UPI0027F51DFF|nr:hypothetical protein [Klebsiella aerogenes]EKZ5284885.1 hypothetical protein [Klebsiella aerogenes]MDT4310192.1 hypothetical protein [Klebsiella aerogenes]